MLNPNPFTFGSPIKDQALILVLRREGSAGKVPDARAGNRPAHPSV